MYAARIKIGSELVLASTVPKFSLDVVLRKHLMSALGMTDAFPCAARGHALVT